MGGACQAMADGKTKTEPYTSHVTWNPPYTCPFRLPAVCERTFPASCISQPVENLTSSHCWEPCQAEPHNCTMQSTITNFIPMHKKLFSWQNWTCNDQNRVPWVSNSKWENKSYVGINNIQSKAMSTFLLNWIWTSRSKSLEGLI